MTDRPERYKTYHTRCGTGRVTYDPWPNAQVEENSWLVVFKGTVVQHVGSALIGLRVLQKKGCRIDFKEVTGG